MSSKGPTTTTILNIRNMRTRALLRGLLDRNIDAKDARAAFSGLIQSMDKTDFPVVDSLIRNGSLFKHIPIIPEFPFQPPFQGSRDFSMMPTREVALDYVLHRISLNEAAIATSIWLLSELNLAVLLYDDASIIGAIDKLLSESGHSLTLARIISFIIGYRPKDTDAYKRCISIVDEYGVNGKNYGMIATIDAIGNEFNYLDIAFKFRKFAKIDQTASPAQELSHLAFHPVATTVDHFHAVLGATYNISLTDAAYTILVHRELGVLDSGTRLPEAIEKLWTNLSSLPMHELVFFKGLDNLADIQTFRVAPAFLENPHFRNLRIAIEPIFTLPSTRQPLTPLENNLSRAFFEPVHRFADLVPPGRYEPVALPESFDQLTAGQLVRSCGVVWLCDKDPDFAGVSAGDMAKLMGATFEMDRLLSTPVLRGAAATSTDDFVTLILRTLLRAHSGSTKDNYSFKAAFQSYVRHHFESNIIAFLTYINSLSPNIVAYYVSLLDETMLSQMAFLMRSADSIYETRAEILDWYADVTGDNDSRSKAKQLRLDRKIAAVRGAINEARINIDSVRFRQWIEQNKITDFSNLSRQSDVQLPDLDELTDRRSRQTIFLSSHRDPTIRALNAIVECYGEFCRNVDFGIASFLGRRIRHGTLRGTLLTGLPKEAPPYLAPSTADQYQTWIEGLPTAINTFASRLHFLDKSSHRSGAISAEIDTSAKWQACLVCLRSVFDAAQKDNGVLVIPQVIENYCWLIFEFELATVQSLIAEARSKWGALKLRHPSSDGNTMAFEKDINIILENHFNTAISWFRKPPNISPVAEIGHVLEVVLQEANDEYPSFTANIDFEGDKELELSGSIYYTVYDTLTIAVRNAAKHGSCTGTLIIRTEVCPSGKGQKLRISISSGIKADDSVDNALARIEAAGRAGPYRADVVEGLSGIRKLEKMKVDRSILEFEAMRDPSAPDRLCMEVEMALTGIVG